MTLRGGIVAEDRDVSPSPGAVCAAAIVAGAVPLARFVVAYELVWIAALTGFCAVGWLVDQRRTRRPTGVMLQVDGPVLAVVVALCLLSLSPTPVMPDPSPLAASVLPASIVGSVLLSLWTLGGLGLPFLGPFNRALAAPVVAMLALGGLYARSPDRFLGSLILGCVAAAIAVAIRFDRDRVVTLPDEGGWVGFRRTSRLEPCCPQVPWRVDGPVLALALTFLLLSLSKSSATGSWIQGLLEPTLSAAPAFLAFWALGAFALPFLGSFDRTLAVPSVFMAVIVALQSRSPDRFVGSLVLSSAAVCLTLVVHFRPARARSCLDPVRSLVGSMRERVPVALLLPGLGALTWWVLNAGLWTIGVLRGDGVGYGAWRSGISTQRALVHDAVAAVGIVLLPMGVLVLGIAVTLRGSSALAEVARWVAGATLVGLVSGFFWYWTVL